MAAWNALNAPVTSSSQKSRREQLHRARDAFARIGAGRIAADTDRTLAAAGLADPPAGRTERLSRRESDVALLVTAGLSNRQIADRLYIAEKTAAHHVGTILGKLGFGSRAEIAAYVARHADDRPAERGARGASV